MGGEIPYFPTVKKKVKCTAKNMNLLSGGDSAGLPKLERLHPGSRSVVCSLLFSHVAAPVTCNPHGFICRVLDVEARG